MKTARLMKRRAFDAARREHAFADDLSARIEAARRVAGAAMLAGVALSPRLWFPSARSFPRAPLVAAWPESFAPAADWLLGGSLVAALACVVFAKRPTKYLAAAVALLALLALSDQTRLQPWAYQYLLLFAVAALRGRAGPDARAHAGALSALQLIVAALYFWGGAQKLNYTFGREIMPQLLGPLLDYAPLTQTQLSALGVAVAAVEIFTGCGLLFRRTRGPCVRLALALHASALALLVWQGRNSVVWAWNVSLPLVVVILFRRSETFPRPALAWRAEGDARARVAQALAAACALLPALSFCGWWDMYLSGALYSGNTPVAVVRVGGQVYERLPDVARRQVFTTKGGERVLPLFEWSMAELNVPPYPETRVYRQVARRLCELEAGEGRTELIVKERPATLDGSYEVTRTNCGQLVR